MKISKVGIDLIKSFEGCYLNAYRCPAGVLTIGWGCTVGVKEGQVITQKQADDMLMKELSKFEKAVNDYVTYKKINQNMFDALVSFAYNCGSGALKTSTLLKKLNTGDVPGAADEFLRWDKANGKVLNGLTRRRKAERGLFLKEADEVVKDIKINLNGVVKEVGAIEKDGHNYVKLQDLRDRKIEIGYSGMPVVKVR